jgi:hypothetical protein
MLSHWSRVVIHFVGAGLAGAPLAYWTIQLMTPLPAVAPTRLQSISARDPDPVLLSRAFGGVELVAPPLGNIQVAGVYAGGRESAAVFMVGDLPTTVRLGEEVAPGSLLVEVDPQSVTLESEGVRRQLRLPNLPVAMSGASPAEARAGYDRRRRASTLPRMGAPLAARPAGRGSVAAIVPPRPEPRPEPPPEPRPESTTGAPEGRQVVGTAGTR